MQLSCRKYEGSDISEQQYPPLLEARERVAQQDLQGAAELCLKVLRKRPAMAQAHLQLGMIYQSLSEPVKALYHYECYLEARPDTVKADIIRQVIEDERRRLSLSAAPSSSASAPQAAELEELRGRLEKAEDALARASIELEQARLRTPAGTEAPPEWARERVRLLTENDQLRRERERLAARPTPSPTPTVAPSPQEPRIYSVQAGDTLGSIARKMYGEASQWRRIQAANEDKIRDLRNLRPGVTLVIP